MKAKATDVERLNSLCEELREIRDMVRELCELKGVPAEPAAPRRLAELVPFPARRARG